MNNYDGSRKKEIDEIIDYFFQMGKCRTLEVGDVYNVLCCYGLKNEDKTQDGSEIDLLSGRDNEYLFEHWVDRFKDKKNTQSFVDPSWACFCQFMGNYKEIKDKKKYIKLYIPVDFAHLKEGVDAIFDYLDSENIVHESKVSNSLRVDNVIIRINIDDVESANKIIEFINSDPFLKGGLNKPNPFVPTVGGIGYIFDRGNSYNTDISCYIVQFINHVISLGYESVTAADFRDFLYYCRDNRIIYNKSSLFDEKLLKNFEMAYSGNDKNLNSKTTLSFEEKNDLLSNALIETYKKHGEAQVREALLQILKNNNYDYITTGENNNYRFMLENYVSSEDVLEIINKNNHDIIEEYDSIDKRIKNYCDALLNNVRPLKL